MDASHRPAHSSSPSYGTIGQYCLMAIRSGNLAGGDHRLRKS
jgi:hypothetical protein